MDKDVIARKAREIKLYRKTFRDIEISDEEANLLASQFLKEYEVFHEKWASRPKVINKGGGRYFWATWPGTELLPRQYQLAKEKGWIK